MAGLFLTAEELFERGLRRSTASWRRMKVAAMVLSFACLAGGFLLLILFLRGTGPVADQEAFAADFYRTTSWSMALLGLGFGLGSIAMYFQAMQVASARVPEMAAA